MKHLHLSDEILQAFALNERQDDTTAEHLSACSICRQRLEAYQHLMAGIEQIKPEVFSFDVTALAMDQIGRYEKKKNKKENLVFWGVSAIVSIGISGFAIPFVPTVFAIFNSESIFTTLLVIGTGLAVLLFLLADAMRQYQKKERQLFKDHLQPMH